MRWNSHNDVAQLASKFLPLPGGEIWECGVYRGTTSAELARLALACGCTLRLFDTFTGRPPISPEDGHIVSPTDFSDTSLEVAQQAVGEYPAQWHVGRIPDTFVGLEGCRVAFAYVDMDLYQSTYDALSFILPRLLSGGYVLVDDYESGGVWPGVKVAVDKLVPHFCRTVLSRCALIHSGVQGRWTLER